MTDLISFVVDAHTIASFVFFLLCVTIILIVKKKTLEFENTIDSLSINMKSNYSGILPDDYFADIVYDKERYNNHTKGKKENKCIDVEIIGNEYSKGYDFMICSYKKGECKESIPIHKHSRTAEFFVVLSGNFIINIENNSYIITEGNSVYVPPKTSHSLVFEEDCTFITVAKPPIFSRIGRFYEKIWKRITNTD